MSLTLIVLATGQGARFRSDLPRVVQPLADRPMVRYVVDAARALDPANLVLVTSPDDEDSVREAAATSRM